MNIQFTVTKPGAELVLNALSQLPYATSAGLIRELETQANQQLQAQQTASAPVAVAVAVAEPDVQPETE